MDNPALSVVVVKRHLVTPVRRSAPPPKGKTSRLMSASAEQTKLSSPITMSS
jgi:hypothetical protein